ncbi:MAG TPA: lipopolysaccharide biosynthesis protein [Solirubrobacterales bacterium]|nr:lipopolysaccharide biosynthesis protein [Solirubrobacterales bacterium]
MFEYLRRLATTGAAYTASSVLSKLIAVFLLPVYTAYLSPSDYGAAEVMLASVIAASIVVRFGVIEAILRFYYVADEDRRAVVSTGFAALLWATTAGAAIALALAGPISEFLLEYEDAGLARLAILGLWTLTLWEFVLTLLRLDERPRLYFVLTVINVVVTIPVTVYLVVEADLGADAILLGTFGTGVFFLLWRLWEERRRLSFVPDSALLRRMVRFGLPTMPAELTLYSLNFIDRILLVRLAGLAEAGLYALAIKFANGMQVLSRGFQLAFPPLAYSIADDEEARRAYSLLFTWFAAVCAFGVAGLWLLSRSLVDVLAAEEFAEAHEAIGLLATGVALYALYLALVVILGRTGRTEFNFPATAAGTAANVVLNLVLIPPLGIVGAGLALVGSYVIVLVLMYAFTQRLFPVPYEWRRLALLVLVTAATIGAGEALLPTEGVVAAATRTALWLALPLLLLAAGFLTAEERLRLRAMLSPAAVRERLQALRAAPAPSEPASAEASGGATETYEQAIRDQDRGAV